MRRPTTKRIAWLRSTAVLVILALLAVNGTEVVYAVAGQATPSVKGHGYQDYGLAALGPNDAVSLNVLKKATSNDLSVAGMTRFIQADLISFNIRRVLLDIGWQNFTKGVVPHESWIDNWFTACDSLGIGNVLYVGQLTKNGIGSPWVMSLIRSDPSAQTYSSDGKPAPYLSPENPDVARQLESDLASLHSYYGNHSSWIGIGTGSEAADPYYGSNSSIPSLGYSNATLAAFANSVFFASDVSSTGRTLSGTLDLLWAEFRNVQSSVIMSSGNWQLSIPISVLGNSTKGNVLAMRFYLAQRQNGIQIEWYGYSRGNKTGAMEAEILKDSAGNPNMTGIVSSQTQNPQDVTQVAGWQGPMKFQGLFDQGYYWLYLSSPSSTSSSNYQVFVRNYLVDNLYALDQGINTSRRFSNAGDATLWVKSLSGTSLSILPYEQPLVVPSTQQDFKASSSFAFNTVYLFLSDRHFNPTDGTISISDDSLNKVVDYGILSQNETHGLQNWIPIPLNQTLVAQKGHNYTMTISEPQPGVSWIVALRGLTVDPPAAGFQGQSNSWLFRLALVNWGASHFDFTADVSNGADSVGPGHPDAVAFKVPGPPGGVESVKKVSMFMYSADTSGTFYPPNVNLTVSINGDNLTGGIPLRKSLQSVTILGSSVRQLGWLNVTGFNLKLNSGSTYWAVFSTTSQASFPLARLVSPYKLEVLISRNGGISWTNPAEGPSDASMVVQFADGKQVGNFIQDVPIVGVDDTNFFAQPFVELSTSQASGIFVGPIKVGKGTNSFLLVSLNPDDGTGHPSGDVLAMSKIYPANVTLDYGLQFVQFTSATTLEAGQRYWIVLQGFGGSFAVEPVVYSHSQPGAPSSMVSGNSGYSWKPYSNLTTVLSYRIETPSVALPTYSTLELSGDLARYHGVDPNADPSRGWNSYIQSLEIQRVSEVSAWFETHTGKALNFYGTGNPGILANLSPQNFVYLKPGGTVTTCQDLKSDLLSRLPTSNQQFATVEQLSLLKTCVTGSQINMVGQLNYVKYQGPGYGLNTSENVLVLGGTPTNGLAESLLGSYNVIYVNANTNPETAVNAMDSKIRTIILDGSVNPGPALSMQLSEFVHRGGTLVSLSPLPQLSAFLGGSSSSPAPGQANLWAKNTVYAQDLKVNSVNGSLTASSMGISIRATKYGQGELVSLEKGGQNSTIQASEPYVVLSNIVQNSFMAGSGSPFWYGPLGTPIPSAVTYGIKGTQFGQILVWASNPSPTAENFTITLNGTYYHLPSSWKVLDLSTLSVQVGSGNSVTIKVPLPPTSWAPFYIIGDNASIKGDYSSLAIGSDLRYSNQELLKAQGPANQSALVVLTASSTIHGITLDESIALQKVRSTAALMAARNGWFVDNSTGTVFIKWDSNSASTLRLLYASNPVVAPAQGLPESLFLGVFLFLLLAEIVALVYLRLVRRDLRKSLSRGKSNLPSSNQNLPSQD